MTTLTESQKIKLAGLQKELRQAEQEIVKQPDLESAVETAAHITWLKRTIEFIQSPWYAEYKRQNGDDDGTDNALSGSLRDAGFGESGVI